jgi:translation elongation factor EF-4
MDFKEGEDKILQERFNKTYDADLARQKKLIEQSKGKKTIKDIDYNAIFLNSIRAAMMP